MQAGDCCPASPPTWIHRHLGRGAAPALVHPVGGGVPGQAEGAGDGGCLLSHVLHGAGGRCREGQGQMEIELAVQAVPAPGSIQQQPPLSSSAGDSGAGHARMRTRPCTPRRRQRISSSSPSIARRWEAARRSSSPALPPCSRCQCSANCRRQAVAATCAGGGQGGGSCIETALDPPSARHGCQVPRPGAANVRNLTACPTGMHVLPALVSQPAPGSPRV